MQARTGSQVLVVEDDGAIRTFYRRALERGGLTTIDAGGGDEALRLIRSGIDFEAAIIDGLLPDMHGIALARRLVDDPAGSLLPLLFVTGALRGTVKATAGIAALAKPVAVGALIEQITDLRAWRQEGGSPIEERHQALAQIETGFLVGP